MGHQRRHSFLLSSLTFQQPFSCFWLPFNPSIHRSLICTHYSQIKLNSNCPMGSSQGWCAVVCNWLIWVEGQGCLFLDYGISSLREDTHIEFWLWQRTESSESRDQGHISVSCRRPGHWITQLNESNLENTYLRTCWHVPFKNRTCTFIFTYKSTMFLKQCKNFRLIM